MRTKATGGFKEPVMAVHYRGRWLYKRSVIRLQACVVIWWACAPSGGVPGVDMPALHESCLDRLTLAISRSGVQILTQKRLCAQVTCTFFGSSATPSLKMCAQLFSRPMHWRVAGAACWGPFGNRLPMRMALQSLFDILPSLKEGDFYGATHELPQA